MNSKMLMAPILAVVLALIIAGAVTMFLPLNQPDQTKTFTTTGGTLGANGVPAPSSAPQAAASAADIFSFPSLIMLGVAAVIVGLAVVLLFFRKEPQ